MASIYLGSVRSWLRRYGIVRLVTLPERIRYRKRRSWYERERPDHVEARVGRASGVMRVDDAVEYARVLSFKEDDHIIRAILDRSSEGSSFWDVGANIGLYSVLVASVVGETGQVVAFEPEPRSHQRLLENLDANRLSNVRVLRFALGRERQQAQCLAAEQASLGNHRLIVDGNHANGGAPNIAMVVVDVISGDELKLQEGLAVPAVIKLDVEGMEEDVLLGMPGILKDPCCRAVVCEVHFSILEATGQSESPRRIMEFLKACGFAQLTWLDRSHLLAAKGDQRP